jgi:signal transduction histidine kinase
MSLVFPHLNPAVESYILEDAVPTLAPSREEAFPARPPAMRLEDHPFFRGLPEAQAQALAAAATIRNCKVGEIIFDEGGESDALFLVMEGRVTFEKSVPGNNWRIISYAVAGDFFGEIGVLTNAPRALRALATDGATIACITRDQLRDFIRRAPGPIDQILQSIVNHLHHTTRHYVDDMLRQEKMSLVGNMVSSIIHDFKNPFTLISLGAQLISTQHQDAKTQKLCANMNKQIQRMVDMANEVSEFAKGVQTFKPSRVEMQSLVLKFRELNEPYFQKERVTIETDVEPVFIEAEENKLLRVLQNLVGNAIDGCDERSDGKVRIEVHDRKENIEIIISDNGKGIPEQIRNNLFDPFVTYGKTGGTGLGTAIVKSIVEAHKGRIRFETTTGQGTTFFIQLPKAQGPRV